MISRENAIQILQNAELICSEKEINEIINRLSKEITMIIGETMPIVMPIMSGALVFAGQLIPKLNFPLQLDYMHLTRYKGDRKGGVLEMHKKPDIDIGNRTVLLIDDILDEGNTLKEGVDWLNKNGCKKVLTTVFANKAIDKKKPIVADFVGLEVPNKYVFGFGMDVDDLWRILPEIYIAKD